MNEIDKTNLTDQTKYWLNEITKIGNYFNQEINQKNYVVKKLRKYVPAFDYRDKVLIILIATSGRVCITSSASVVGAPVGIAGASFTLILVSQALIDMEISHEEFDTITKEKKILEDERKYEKCKRKTKKYETKVRI